MKAIWLTVAAGVVGLTGCASTPKRQMRQPTEEEFATPPAHMYTAPPDIPRDQPLLTPKTNTPAFNSAPGTMGMSGPTSPGMGPGATPGGIRR